eukprot:5394671-Prymnesium_polylepis.1
MAVMSDEDEQMSVAGTPTKRARAHAHTACGGGRSAAEGAAVKYQEETTKLLSCTGLTRMLNRMNNTLLSA